MRPKLDVLMPFDLLTAIVPFEVELRVMKPDIGAKQIFGDINDRTFEPERFEIWIERTCLRDAPQTRTVRCVTGVNKDRRAGCCQAARLVDEAVHRRFQPTQPVLTDEAGQAQIAFFRISRNLCGC